MASNHTTALPVPVSVRTEPQIATRWKRLIGGISPGRIGLFVLMLASEAPVIAVRALLIEAATAIASIPLGNLRGQSKRVRGGHHDRERSVVP